MVHTCLNAPKHSQIRRYKWSYSAHLYHGIGRLYVGMAQTLHIICDTSEKPRLKRYPAEFHHFAIILLKSDPALFVAGSGDKTKLRAVLIHPEGLCRCVMYH